MVNFIDLPTEILNIIFRNLERKDSLQCSITCRAWTTPAQCVLFENLPQMDDEELSNLATTLSNSKNQSPGDFGKKINCSNLSNEFDMALLDKLFPFLEVITFNRHQQALYDQLYTLLMKGKFSSLTKIPFINWNEAHADLLLERKETIKKLEFRDTPSFDCARHTILKSLHLFPRLSLMELNFRHHNTTLCVETMFSRQYPQLRTIGLSLIKPTKIVLNSAMVNINDIQPLTSVQTLYVYIDQQLFSEGDKSYFYFMKKFPRLHGLVFHAGLENTLKTRNYTVPSVDCLSQFLIYLFNFKKSVNIGNILMDHSTAGALKNFFHYVLNQQEKVTINIDITFEPVSRSERNEYPKDRKTFMRFENIRSDRLTTCTLKLIYKVSIPDNVEPYLDLLQAIGNMDITFLSLGGTIIGEEEVPVSLDTIFDHFKSLKTFFLNQTYDVIFSDDPAENRKVLALERLLFGSCKLKEEIFPIISNRCTNLEDLILDDCDLIEGNKIFFINMPLTSLEELRFCTSLNNEDYQSVNCVFIRLTTHTAKPRYCKIIWNESSSSTEYATDKDEYTQADYKRCLDDEHCIVYDIYSKSVFKFIVELADLYDESGKRIYYEEELYFDTI